jgi:mannose-6-phosphate isomerase-like protein (cupin superfamily)
MLHPCIIPWDESRKRQHAKGFAMPFVNQDSCDAKQLALHISVIKPNEGAHEPHAHAGEEIMFLLEGTAEATIGDEKHVISAPCALFCPENVLHGLRNCGQSDIKYMVIRTVSA